MFPKEITQFLKRFQGSIRKRPGRQTKFGRGANPPSTPSYTCERVASPGAGALVAPHRTRAGRGPENPATRFWKKASFITSSDCTSSFPQMPLFFWECQKPRRDARGGFLTAGRRFVPVILRSGAAHCSQKTPTPPKSLPAASHKNYFLWPCYVL